VYQLAEYRLEQLSDASGVSIRNIRAYRERGLLDPARREGRTSVYDDHHLDQLRTISELLRRGFSSAHIAEFFAGVRRGDDLADLLGLQRAMFSRARESTPIDPDGPEAARACAVGLARVVDGHLTFANPLLADLVAGADDPLDYLRTALRVYEATERKLEEVAEATARAVAQAIDAHYGSDFAPADDQAAEWRRRVDDYRALADHVVADLLDAAAAHRFDTAGSHVINGGVGITPAS
jgi:DNA-binding transcriptional MerR regulator